MNSHKAGFVDVYTTHETGSSPDNIAADFICEIGPGARDGISEHSRNAQLITSAPDLLEALHAIVKVLDGSQPKDIPGAIMVARAAIAKATGAAC